MTTPKLNSPINRKINILLVLLSVLFVLVGIMMYHQYNENNIELQIRCVYTEKALTSVVCKDLLLSK